MTEMTTVLQALIAMVIAALCSGLYSLGGRKWKAWRRYFASLLFVAGFCGLAYWRGLFSWWLLLIWPGLLIQYSLGYGGNSIDEKVEKRFLIIAVMVCIGLMAGVLLHVGIVNIATIITIQALVGVASLMFAVKNPFEAAFEEAFVCMVTTMPLMGYLFTVR